MCQGTIQRHSDILGKEAQPPREERKETVKKKKKKRGGEGGGVKSEPQRSIKTEKKSDFLTVLKWKDWPDTGYFIFMVLNTRMTSFCPQLTMCPQPSPLTGNQQLTKIDVCIVLWIFWKNFLCQDFLMISSEQLRKACQESLCFSPHQESKKSKMKKILCQVKVSFKEFSR